MAGSHKSPETIKKRAAFLAAAATGRKWVAPFFVLQIGQEASPENETVRYGLTATKRIGGAVVRNRARRRMRALAQGVLAAHASPRFEYVLIARPTTITAPFDVMRQEMERGLKRLKLWVD